MAPKFSLSSCITLATVVILLVVMTTRASVVKPEDSPVLGSDGSVGSIKAMGQSEASVAFLRACDGACDKDGKGTCTNDAACECSKSPIPVVGQIIAPPKCQAKSK